MLKRYLRWVMGKTEPMEKFGKLNRWKIHVSSFPIVDRISASAIMKKLKNGYHLVNINHMENFKFTDPAKVLGLWFSECWQKQNITVSHYEKIEKWLPFG